ncbi:MAG: MBG domain-containing protein, partial [Clostridia bacterium]|nr:MBG domain-containing protein [Clostridia bacterium]
ISSSKIFDVWTYPEKHSGVVKLYFSNDIDVTVVYGHSFFEKEQNKYVAVTRDNVSAFVDHEFYNVDKSRWETLERYEFIDGEVDTYVITTEYNLNCVANGMLTNEDGFYTMITNIFDYGDDLKIDESKKESDIDQYGTYGFENLKYMSRETYEKLNFKYLNVAIGKGMITTEEISCLGAYWSNVDSELFCDEKEETPVSKSGLLKAPLKAPLLTSSVPAPTSGFYVGGLIKILGNNGGNLYLSSEKTITIGTGTDGDGNGVVAPTEDMKIGITLQDGVGAFTVNGNGTAEDVKYFTSDNAEYDILFNTESKNLGCYHAHNNIKFSLWTETSKLPTEAGNYVLTTDVTISETWTVPTGTTNLCLNGHVINANCTEDNKFGVIKVGEGATLNLYDCGDTKHNGYVDSTGLWHYDSTGTHELLEGETAKTITGGMITGGNASGKNTEDKYGGGVYVTGTLNMFDGNIAGNTAVNGGAGIYITGGTFEMNGGAISYNYASVNNAIGGGIYGDSSSITLNSGTINNNSANGGGGIYLSKTSSMEMNGGIITENKARGGQGGGIQAFFSGKFTMTAGSITNNQAVLGGGIFINSKDLNFSMSGGTISGNNVIKYMTFPLNGGGIYLYNFASATFGGSAQITGNTLGSENPTANNVYLPDGKTITLGTGTGDGGNGVDVPTTTGENKMQIGITLNAGTGKFTANGTADYSANFFSDSDSYKVCFNVGTEDPDDEYLELKKVIAEIICTNCGGKGRTDSNCPICHGSGDDCCDRTGKALCQNCNGKGKFTFTSLEDAINAVANGGKIVLLNDNSEEIEISKVITFDIDAGDFTNDATFSTVDNYVIEISENEGVTTYAIKKPVEFDSEYEWNDGEDITYGDTYSEISPKVYYNEVEVMELSFTFVYYQTTDGETWTKLEGVATDAGDYKVVIAVNDATYCGSKEFTFTIGKAEQVIVINDISKIYDALVVYANYSKLGDGEVTIEYKLATEDDDKYTTTAPINAGSYVIRVSVAEGTNYLADSETKEFTIAKATISKVGFGDVAQPVATETAPTTVSGIAIGSRYAGTISWSPALNDGDFDYNTTYTVTITLDIVPSSIDNYRFADNFTLVKPTSEGWTKSSSSTNSKLIYTKTFAKTGKTPQVVEITNDISKTYDATAVSALTYTKLGEGTATIEYKLASEDDDKYTTTTPINAGSYIVRVSVAETETHLSGFTTKEFTISPKAITVTVSEKTSVYGDNTVSLTATDNGIVSGDENVYSLSTTASKTSFVGSYDITGEALDDNYSITFENEENAYTITQREVTLTWGETTFAYEKTAKLPTATAGNLANSDKVTVTVVSNKESVNVGEYVATATALSNNNYKLPTTNLTTNFVINKADYDMTGITFTDKTVKTTDSDENKKLVISGTLPTGLDGVQLSVSYVDNDNTERGVYTVTAKFSTTSINYNTPSDMTAVLTILWVRDSEKESESDNEFVIVTSETGIDPTLTLKVDVVKIDNSDSQYKEVTDSIKKEDSFNANLDKIFGVYDVSLIDQNDVKVQPDGTIKVYMTIPEEIKNCEFRIYHIHNGVASKADYVIDDGYAVIETDELSEFVFVYEQTSLLPWIIVLSVISALGLAGIVLLLVKNKKDKQGRK